MSRIKIEYSSKRNKEIILEAAFKRNGLFKTHVKKAVVLHSRSYDLLRWFEEWFQQLIDENLIIYIPFKPLRKGAMFGKPIIKCRNCENDMYDKIKAISKEPLYICPACGTVFWRENWWNKQLWRKHVELTFSI